ncbi:MAG: PGF-CTERM sorting domain-containing protein [Halanaeroarchaeum sp.]
MRTTSYGAEFAEYTCIEVEQTGSTAAIERIEADLHAAVEAYEAGNSSEALALIRGTYLTNFEGIEGTLIAENPELVEDLEAAFNEDLPALIRQNASVSTVRERVETMESKLETAENILSTQEETDITLESPDTTTEGTATSTSEPPNASTTRTTSPGFTVVSALAALIAIGLVRRFR